MKEKKTTMKNLTNRLNRIDIDKRILVVAAVAVWTLLILLTVSYAVSGEESGESNPCADYAKYKPYLYQTMTDEARDAWLDSVPVPCRSCLA